MKYYSTLEKKENSAISNNKDGSRGHSAKGNKPATKKISSNESTCIRLSKTIKFVKPKIAMVVTSIWGKREIKRC